MEVIAAGTLWGLFSAWLLFPVWDVPRMLRNAAAALLFLELASLLVWGYGSESCTARPCAVAAELARAAAGIDIPALAVAVLLLTIAHGIRRRRRAADRPRRLRDSAPASRRTA